MDLAASRAPVAGNHFDKYGTSSPVLRRVMGSFFGALDRCWSAAGPVGSVLDVGCGEGVITRTWARRVPAATVVGVDRGAPRLRSLWNAAPEPNVTFQEADAQALPFPDRSFDLVSGIEVLMQVDDPGAALAELVRCARVGVLVSVPREPLWRALNVASGRYVRALGNSPATRHHLSAGAFERLVAEHAHVQRVERPVPWTVVLARP